MLDTVLFDLDGTLLPMEQEAFTKAYFVELIKKVALIGIDKDTFKNAVVAGTDAMFKNDGSFKNDVVFWSAFQSVVSKMYEDIDYEDIQDIFIEFYENEFNNVKEQMTKQVDNGKIIKELKSKGYYLILATQPVFPGIAMKSRLAWAGVDINDFDYITTYDNSFCVKPNLKYYQEILDSTGREPSKCIMVGNNPIEDGAVSELGVDVFIVNDIVEGHSEEIKFPHGSLEEAVKYIKSH